MRHPGKGATSLVQSILLNVCVRPCAHEILVKAQRPKSFFLFWTCTWTLDWDLALGLSIQNILLENFVKLFEINISNILIRDFFTMSVIV